MKRFSSDIPALYHPDHGVVGEVISLDSEESRHIRALRLLQGDRVQLLDGAGKRTFGTLQKGERGSFQVRIEETTLEEEESEVYIGLAIGLLAGKSRMEWVIEKGVELGVRSIMPLKSSRSEGFFNAGRAHRIAVAALKQSQRVRLPEISEVEWGELEDVASSYDALILCHEQESADVSLITALEKIEGNGSLLILVGPEGGFTEEEVNEAREELNAIIVSLGPSRLRAETAAIAAVAGVQIIQNSKSREEDRR